MTLGIIILIMLFIPVFLYFIAGRYYNSYDKHHAISSGKRVPETLGGKLFKFVRTHAVRVTLACILSYVLLAIYSTGILLGQWSSQTFIGEYETVVKVCNKSDESSDGKFTSSRQLLATPMELGLIRCKYRNERMYGLFDLFVSDDIYTLPEKIIKR